MALVAHKTLVRLLAIAVVGSLPLAASAQGITEIIVKSGDAPPDGNGTFEGFEPPALNDAGQTAFYAVLYGSGGGDLDDTGLYRGESSIGALTLIVREKSPGPNHSGITYLGIPTINAGGQLAFRARYWQSHSAGGNLIWHVYRGVGGSPLASIAAEGGPVPDGNGVFESLATPVLNDSGQAAFYASIAGTIGGENDNSGIFRGGASIGSITQIAREKSAGAAQSGLTDIQDPTINGSGQVAFKATRLRPLLAGGGSFPGVHLGSGGSLTTIAAEGDPLPEGDGMFDGSFGAPEMNDAGQVAFVAGPSGSRGIFLGGAGEVVQIARENPATLASSGLADIDIHVRPALNENGDVAFGATFIAPWIVGGESRPGVFRSSGGSLIALAAANNTAPDGNGTFATFYNPRLNDAGQAAFLAELSNTDNGTSDDLGIYLANGIDILQVARKGQILAGHTITGLSIRGGKNGGLNNAGQVAFRAVLDNGDQAIARFTIPEVHWTAPASGLWTTAANWNWAQGIVPNSFHDTFIDPSLGLTVTGSPDDTFVKSLSVGATEFGVAELDLDNGGDLEALESVTINDRGKIHVGADHALTAAEMMNHGTLHVRESGAIHLNSGALMNVGGRVAGEGTIHLGGAALFNQGGIVGPGDSTGTLTLADGDFFQDGVGGFEVELGGTEDGEYDQMLVDGRAILDGKLHVALIDIDLFEPDAGDSFDILTATGGVHGVFASELLPTLSDPLSIYVLYDPTVVKLLTTYKADFDQDGDVDGDDFLVWQSGFGSGGSHTEGDADGDGDNDGDDFLLWQSQFGSEAGSGASAAVPEPPAIALTILAGMLGLVAARR